MYLCNFYEINLVPTENKLLHIIAQNTNLYIDNNILHRYNEIILYKAWTFNHLALVEFSN